MEPALLHFQPVEIIAAIVMSFGSDKNESERASRVVMSESLATIEFGLLGFS